MSICGFFSSVSYKASGDALQMLKAYKTRDEAKDDCKRLLAQTMLRNGICADGQYWVVYELNRYLFGDFNGLDEMDEGEITMKNKVVTDVPAGFWLPF